MVKMQSLTAVLLVTSAFLRGAAADPSESSEVVTLDYERNDRTSVPMDIQIDRDANTIAYHMKDNAGFFADVDTFEDYETGYAVSRVDSQESCFLRRLTESLDKTVERLHGLEEQGLQHILGNAEVWAEPLNDLEGLAGPRLASFCGDVPVYKLVKPDDSIERKSYHQKDSSSASLATYLKESSSKAMQGKKRQTTVTFYFCFLFFFFPICYNTNVTINTGTTFTFFLFG